VQVCVARVTADPVRGYRARCLELPVLLRQAGLCQTVGFLKTDLSHGGSRLISDVAGVVAGFGVNDLMAVATLGKNIDEYLWASVATGEVAETFARLASSLPVESDGAGASSL
jgi:hypothetical protein